MVLQFHVPGPAFGPGFTGLRRDEFSRRQRMVGIDVAVPLSLPPGSEVGFVWAACREAVDVAEEYLRTRKLDWPVAPLRESLQALHECLHVPSPELPLSHWLQSTDAADKQPPTNQIPANQVVANQPTANQVPANPAPALSRGPENDGH